MDNAAKHSKHTLVVAAAGDALVTAPFPASYDRDKGRIRDYLATAEVRMANRETNIGPFGGFASAYSGGTWLNAEPEVLDDLLGYGFNFLGTANNHTMDYSYGGLLATARALRARRVAFAGTGRSLAEAGAPAVIRTSAGKVGVVAATTSFEAASKAGRPSLGSKARPGVNYVRSTRYNALSPEDFKALGAIVKRSGINAYHDLMVATGFAKPDEEGVLPVGATLFCREGERKPSVCHAGDLARIVESIRSARRDCAYVFAMLHCHQIDGARICEPPAFLEELAHACVDAGAAAVFGGGAHELRPVELYHGAPIFYSLGDFVYQGMRVKFLPADFMEKYGQPDNATALEGLLARSQGGKIGLQAQECNFLTLLPRLTFADGRLAKCEMLPVDLAFTRRDDRNGLPRPAAPATARRIFEIVDALSRPYGTRLSLRGGHIDLDLEEGRA